MIDRGIEPLPMRQELTRKLVHTSALALPAGCLLLERHVLVALLVVACLIVLGADIARLRWGLARNIYGRFFGDMTRSEEATSFSGASYMILGQTLTALVFPAPIAVTAMTFGVVGDSAAAIIGTRYGRRRFLRGKSVEGSLACFAASFIGGGVWFLLPLPIVAAGALTTAFSEAVDSHINDNLIIPLAAACVMFALAA